MANKKFSVEDLGDVAVFNEKNEPTELSSLWLEKTAVLVFVRHFGWIFCRQQVADLARNAYLFHDKNSDLAVIGSGDPVHFTEFRKKTGYDGLLFSDPSLKAFSILGFSNGLMGFVSIRSVFNAASALKQGHRQGSIQGSPLQLGGAVVIDVSGAVRYFFAEKKAGDHPDMEQLLKAVEKETPNGIRF